MAELCEPNRLISVSRELTKKFEETITGPISDVILHFQNKAPKGEFVVVLAAKNIEIKSDEIEN